MRIANPPTRLTDENYERETERYAELLNGVTGVEAVGTVGSVGTPGYSDIDYIVLVNEEFRRSDASKLFHRHKDRDRRIVLHAPLITSRELYPAMFHFLVFDKPIPLFGDWSHSEAGEYLSTLESNRIANLIDFAEARVNQYFTQELQGVVDQRHAVTAMWSATHTARICSEVGVNLSSRSQTTIAALHQQREDWRNGRTQSANDFLSLRREVHAFNVEVFLSALALELRLIGATEPGNDQASVFRFSAGSKQVLCSTQTTEPSASVRVVRVRGLRYVYSTTVRAPIELAVHLNGYGFLARNSHQTWLAGSPSLAGLLERRAFAQAYYEFLGPKGLSSANGPYVVLPPAKASSVKHRGRLRCIDSRLGSNGPGRPFECDVSSMHNQRLAGRRPSSAIE